MVCFYLAEPTVHLYILPQGYTSSALCPNIVYNDLDQPDLLLNITLFYLIDDAMQSLSDEQKVASILMPWKNIWTRGWGNRAHTISGAHLFGDISRGSLMENVQIPPPRCKTSCWTLYHTPWKKEAQCSVKLFGIRSQYIPFKCTALTYLQSHLVRLPFSIGEQKEKRLWSNSRLHYKLLHHLGLMILQIQWYLTSPWLLGILYWASERHP